MWLKLGDHEYINIAKINFWMIFFFCRGDFGGKSIFLHPKMLIYAS